MSGEADKYNKYDIIIIFYSTWVSLSHTHICGGCGRGAKGGKQSDSEPRLQTHMYTRTYKHVHMHTHTHTYTVVSM